MRNLLAALLLSPSIVLADETCTLQDVTYCNSPESILEVIERNGEEFVWQGEDDMKNTVLLFQNPHSKSHTSMIVSKDGSVACVLSFSSADGEPL